MDLGNGSSCPNFLVFAFLVRLGVKTFNDYLNSTFPVFLETENACQLLLGEFKITTKTRTHEIACVWLCKFSPSIAFSARHYRKRQAHRYT